MAKRDLIVIILIFLVLFLVSCQQQYIQATGNFHTHTLASFDSNETYEKIIDEAVRLGFDFIVITDHNVIDEKIKEKCLAEKRLLCIIGLEVTPFIDHIVAVDFDKYIDPKTKPEDVIRQIHSAGGVAIAPHPLPENGGFTLQEIAKLEVDAMECYIPRNGQQFPAIKPCVYNSDAHNAEQLKDAYSVCDVKDIDGDGNSSKDDNNNNNNRKITKEAIKDALKKGRCRKGN